MDADTNSKAVEMLIERIICSPNDWFVLGVAREASKSEIKKAYRKISLVIHPDKNSSARATEAFQKVSAAYDRLMKDEGSHYDKHDFIPRKPPPKPQWQPPPPPKRDYQKEMFDDFVKEFMDKDNRQRAARSKKHEEKGQCEGITKAGTRCQNAPNSGSRYCTVHKEFDPSTYQPPKPSKPLQRCQGQTKSGDRCKKMTQEEFCSVHRDK